MILGGQIDPAGINNKGTAEAVPKKIREDPRESVAMKFSLLLHP